MIARLLQAGLEIPPGSSTRFVLDGVLALVQTRSGPRHRHGHGKSNMRLLEFLASKGPDGEPRQLQALLGGRVSADERPLYLVVAASFIDFVLQRHGVEQLATFARNLNPAEPRDASRAAFRESFVEVTEKWRAWALSAHGKQQGVGGFVVQCLKLFARQRVACIVTFVAMVPQLAYTMLMPVGLAILFDGGILKHDARVITNTLIWLTAGYVVSAIGGLAQDYYSSIAATRGMTSLRAELFQHCQKLASEVLQQTDSGRLTAVFASDLTMVGTVVARVLPNLLFRLLLLVGSVIIAFKIEWHMALAAVVGLPLAMFAPRPMAQAAGRWSYRRKGEEAALAGLVQESITLNRTIRMFHLQANRLTAFRRVLGNVDDAETHANVYASFTGRLTNIGASFVQLFVIAIGAVLSLTGAFEAGVVVAFIGLLLNIGGGIAGIADAIPLLIQGGGAWKRVEMLLAEPVSPDELLPAKPGSWSGVTKDIRFGDVVFGYPGYDPVVDGVSFDIKMGELVVFVGPSGSGKTTLLNLLQRHVYATDGEVLLDGTPIDSIAEADLRQGLATVAQDSALFNMSIRENIRMGREDATDEEIEAAAKAAGIDETIRGMAQGYDTPVGEGGGHLSGGQRQRIAIARALLRDPKVLVLDEATSALDPATEKEINATLERVRGGRIIVAVTHRLQEAANMDRIIVVRAGRVVETGSHEELLANKSVYADLWAMQTGLSVSEDGVTAEISPDALRAIPFFRGLDDAPLAEIARSMRVETVPKDLLVLDKGEISQRFFIITRGNVTLSAMDPHGDMVVVKTLGPGDYFGQFALAEYLHQLFSVTTSTQCSLLSLQREAFVRALAGNDAARQQIEIAISDEFDSQLDDLVAYGTGSASESAPEPAAQPA